MFAQKLKQLRRLTFSGSSSIQVTLQAKKKVVFETGSISQQDTSISNSRSWYKRSSMLLLPPKTRGRMFLAAAKLIEISRAKNNQSKFPHFYFRCLILRIGDFQSKNISPPPKCHKPFERAPPTSTATFLPNLSYIAPLFWSKWLLIVISYEIFRLAFILIMEGSTRNRIKIQTITHDSRQLR